ncbi:flagellar basal body P-ring formation chaperone FlgA [Caballeronia humi]|uniref:Flagellar basal body P-ring biosynthesis protein FlgA n=1 Tax=Caballeronia humi TaxID=326474 RepID=A0A158JE87_9BURK|nr:flagellar basal body P-ring biosynthesis protein FlgA [Caballeronia humi]
MSRSAPHRATTRARVAPLLRSMFSAAGGVALAFGVAGQAIAQEDGPIAIPGNAETNPAAVAAMAQRVAMSAPSSTAMNAARPRGYAAATSAADAAMQSAARALDAHADAADDSMSDASGMIVIPGPGEAKPAAPAVNNMSAARVAAPSSAMSASSLPRVQTANASRDVMPVVVVPESATPAARGAAARPIAAASAAPVAARAGAASVAQASAPAAPAAGTQDTDAIRAAALAFLQQQTAGLPGKPEITVTPVFPRGLAPCTSLDPFMPTGARLWGRTTVGVRCTGERPWTLYLQVRISINATYYLASRAIAPGEVLTSADLLAREGDLTAMPQAVITDPTQAVGAVALSRVPAGLPLRTDMLRSAASVSIGQNVHVVADGTGFSISADGAAMNNAAPGQQVRVKTSTGQIITGVVKDSQTVEIRL